MIARNASKASAGFSSANWSKRLVRLWKRDTWVKPFFGRYKRTLFAALGLGFLTFSFAALLMFTSGYLVSGAAEVESILLLHLPLIFVRIFGVGKPVLHYAERLFSHDWVLRMTSGLRLKLYRALEKDAMFSRATRKTGDMLGLLSEDIGHVQNLYLRTVFPLAIAWLLYAALIVALGLLSLGAAIAVAFVLALGIILMPLVSVLVNGARQMRRKQLKGLLYAELTDNVLGVADWVFSQRGEEYLVHYQEKQDAMRCESAAIGRFARLRDFVMQALFCLVVVILLLWAGDTFGGGPGGGAANWIAAFALGFFPLIEAFAPLPSAVVEAGAHADSIEHLNDLDAEGRKISESGGTCEARAVADSCAGANSCEPAESLDIRFEGVTFRYPGASRAILENFDLQVAHGEKIAILGRSGVGKSTLASLVRGDLSPEGGRVTIGGVPSVSMGDDIARFVGVIQQNTYLFNMPLIENVRIGSPEATRDEVMGVMGKVGLGSLVNRLPQGLDTMVDEAGMRFSGGERHRIALARVLLKNTPVVILDEPTVGLDPATEHALLETLFEALDGKTLIMITHHLQGVAATDRVVFLEDGGIKLEGSPEELERTSSYYRRLRAFDRGGVA